MMQTITSISKEKLVPRIELGVFLVVLLLINIPMLTGGTSYGFSFFPDCFAAGEWWRLITHPFAHISLYHLVLDAGAFALLYQGLAEPSRVKRYFYVIFCMMGSLAISMFSPAMRVGGLCGLSGAAHGLMVIGALEMMKSDVNDRSLRNMGLITFGLVAGKSIIETLTGRVMFAFLHFGDVGTPLTLSHSGGVLAGIVAYLCLAKREQAFLVEKTTY